MLDLTKVAGQIPGMGNHLKKEAAASRQRLEKALALFRLCQQERERWLQQRRQWGERLFFAAAEPVEPLDVFPTLPAPPPSHSVFATDGSQIAPSHHEIAYCYLLNIGRIMLHYGQNRHPLLDSLPQIYYQPEDLYAARQWGIRTEEWMGHRRAALEAECLAELACRWVKPPGPHDEPNLAMMDGSLIYWFLETLPQAARERILNPILNAWEELRRHQIPFMGYLSFSRSTEAVNFLRLPACPFPEPNCPSHCDGLAEGEKTPCQVFDPLRDASFWGHLLQPGQRSPLWRSSLRILDLYPPEQKIYFCYVHVGSEVARVEFPHWVATDATLLNQALGIMLAQVQKGYGYPVALAEAHNQAVVRGSDRARFFALLEQQMARSGLENMNISPKEARKRGSIV
ncbi:MAG: DNA double-strand break repair nuclease NurA [Cyanobacteriota bacterium]|nr:DNA double-strand break repair nuclease NurA [Cyanobacteriota bacterium]